MPFQPERDREPLVWRPAAVPVVSSDWRRGLPVLDAAGVTLREVRVSDAPSLLALLTTDEVLRFITPPPSTVDGWERFIARCHRERAAGRHVCFAVVPAGRDTAVGLFQVRQMEPSFATADWGFILGAPFWGTGLFVAGAELVLDFVFPTLGIQRLEARSVVRNGRANGALRKLGATQEGVLRQSFRLRGQWVDESIWSLLKDEWGARVPPSPLSALRGTSLREGQVDGAAVQKLYFAASWTRRGAAAAMMLPKVGLEMLPSTEPAP